MVHPDRSIMTNSMVHGHCMLDIWGYRHTDRICSDYILITNLMHWLLSIH